MKFDVFKHLFISKAALLKAIYETLYNTYGPQSWWPADTPFEVMLGAILTQNTSWSNVEKAMAGLKEVCELTPEDILSLPLDRLEEAIRPSGYFRQKTKRLIIFCEFYLEKYGGELNQMKLAHIEELRKQFLDLHGVGPETADSILLYALQKPAFVVDAYTTRLFSRLGLCEENVKYDYLRSLFIINLEHEQGMFNEYHALIVRHCKQRCSKRSPNCTDCPLVGICEWEFKI